MKPRIVLWLVLALAMLGLVSCAVDSHLYDKDVNEESPLNIVYVERPS